MEKSHQSNTAGLLDQSWSQYKGRKATRATQRDCSTSLGPRTKGEKPPEQLSGIARPVVVPEQREKSHQSNTAGLLDQSWSQNKRRKATRATQRDCSTSLGPRTKGEKPTEHLSGIARPVLVPEQREKSHQSNTAGSLDQSWSQNKGRKATRATQRDCSTSLGPSTKGEKPTEHLSGIARQVLVPEQREKSTRATQRDCSTSLGPRTKGEKPPEHRSGIARPVLVPEQTEKRHQSNTAGLLDQSWSQYKGRKAKRASQRDCSTSLGPRTKGERTKGEKPPEQLSGIARPVLVPEQREKNHQSNTAGLLDQSWSQNKGRKANRASQRDCCVRHLVLCFVLILWILVFTLSLVSDASTSSKMVLSSTAFHHANATPSAKFFPSRCCSPTVSGHRPLILYPNFLHISHSRKRVF